MKSVISCVVEWTSLASKMVSRATALVLLAHAFPVVAAPPIPDLRYLDELEARRNYYWVDDQGRSFLSYAIQNDQVDRAIRLIEMDALAQLDPRHPFSDVFLEALNLGNQTLIARLLQDAKAKNLLTENLSYDALARAVSLGDLQTTQLLLQESLSAERLYLLHPALLADLVNQDNQELVRLLVDNGYGLNSFNGSGDSALHIAVWKQDEVMVEYLLSHGIDHSLKNRDGLTSLGLALGLAARGESAFAVVDALVAHGANPCESDLNVLSRPSPDEDWLTIRQLVDASTNSAFLAEFEKFNCKFEK